MAANAESEALLEWQGNEAILFVKL